MLFSHIQLRNTYTNICGSKVKNNIRTSMNERTHFLIKMYPSHFILERVAKGLTLVMCERWVGDEDRLSPKVLLTMAALLSLPVWVVQTWVSEGRMPSVCKLILTLAFCPQLTPTATGTRTESLKLSLASAYIIVWQPPAYCGHTHLHRIQPRPKVKMIFRYIRPDAPVSLFSCLLTQVHLLIDSTVEGQHFT